MLGISQKETLSLFLLLHGILLTTGRKRFLLNFFFLRYDFPQAYNYAGQGGTGGHELTHGFDDEGVQFDWDGSMTDCGITFTKLSLHFCSWKIQVWMDDSLGK